MPEETNTNTPNTPQDAPQTNPATPTATDTQTPAVEPNKPQETQPEPAKPEPELTLDSYKDIGLQEYSEVMDLNEEGVKQFKQFGVDNKIPPAGLKAIVDWSVKTIKAQNEAFAKVQEGWRQENAKKYGENLKNVQTNVGRVLADYDKSGNFAKLLQDAGAQDNPATLEFLNAVADVLLEKSSVNPNATAEGKPFTLEDIYKPKQ